MVSVDRKFSAEFILLHMHEVRWPRFREIHTHRYTVVVSIGGVVMKVDETNVN